MKNQLDLSLIEKKTEKNLENLPKVQGGETSIFLNLQTKYC